MTQSFTRRLISVFCCAVLLLTALSGFATVDAARAIRGDFNGDGYLTTLDARQLLIRIVENEALTRAEKTVSDLNDDAAFTTADARKMLLMIVGDQTTSPVDTAVRAMWIPYMEVDDLISSGDPTTARAAIAACFDDCAARGTNVIYFHVRANSDAYYDSSVYNSYGKSATLLAKGFDPLAVAIELAHARGMELHAWVNPYRIGSYSERAMVSDTFLYSNRYYYVPSSAAVQNLVVAGVKELVNNYNIDGVQFDDYFYPEGSVSATTAESFESAHYTAYQNSGGTLSVADWRRSVVNNLVAAVYRTCHQRTGCVFGISPSCNFENNREKMYADAAVWAATPGYVDYLAPQLYVGFEHAYTPYDSILARWDALDRHDGLQMIAGLALYKTGLLDDTWAGTAGRTEWANNNDILSRQIACTKDIGWSGVAFYSHQSFEVGSDRNATVATVDMANACKAWLTFTDPTVATTFDDVRAMWIPYTEVSDLLASGDPATVRSAIADVLDDLADRGTNTVFWHVRANSDAYYDSSVYNPTAKTASLLNQSFDPLACAVEMAHARGMALHAQINPYRVGTSTTNAKVDDVFQYGSTYYYTPSSTAVKNLVVAGITELVQNYDIDGVQFDDAFYPDGAVTDTAAATFEADHYTAYQNAGGTLGLGDWRRSVINDTLAACYSACHKRDNCVFGVNPNLNIDKGYNKLYADVAAWLKTPGYVDYLAPQLYVGFNNNTAFETLLARWDGLTRHGDARMIGGLALYKTGLLDDTWAGTNGRTEWANNNDVMARQIQCVKDIGWNGVALYNHLSFDVDTATRNAAVANADMAGACQAWMMFGGSYTPPQKSAVRAMWIPYFEVEDMLSSGNATTARNKIAACFDDCLARGTNVIYFHVRANSDAYYDSGVFNSYGKAATLISAGFDPLTVAIELAHECGMELHAWVNPYRIGTNSARAKVSDTFYYSNQYYYIPSSSAVKELVVAGVKELVQNYDIDGVQFDDYFYPKGSVSATSAATFEATHYNTYKTSGGTLSVADWRRSVVNDLVAACYSTCHARTGCVFGISPSCNFEANREEMYADAAVWAATPGYVDYLAPQLYVGFLHAATPYESILARWDALERHSDLQMIAGLALYKTGLLDDTWAGTNGRTEWANNDDILSRQIACAKELDWDGIAFYSHRSFEVDSDRDATVANAGMARACVAWLVFQ